MANSRAKVDVTSILSAHDAQRLRQACPDLDDWPRSWHYEPADIDVGQQIVAAFTPFLLHLLDRGLANTTVRRHRDNLWLLGGEIISDMHETPGLRKRPINQVVLAALDEEGGPRIAHGASEDQQRSFDSTCRKLYRFLKPRQ